MTRIRQALSILLIALLAVPAAGASAPSASSASWDPQERKTRSLALRDGLPGPDIRLRSDRALPEGKAEPLRSIIARHLASREAALDPRTYLAVVADVLAANGLPVVRATSSDSTASAPIRIGVGAGDLDGDGRDDVLEVRTPTEPGSAPHIRWALIARRGSNGERMWAASMSADDLLLAPAGDLTGDGRADMLALRLLLDDRDDTGTCIDGTGSCLSVETTAYRWVLEVRSGLNGWTVWTRRYDGRAAAALTDAFLPLGEAWGFALAAPAMATNAFILPNISDDHDGDGTRDILVNAIDIAGAFGMLDASGSGSSAFAYTDPMLTATRAHLLRGRDGEALFERTVPPHPGLAVASTPGNTVGDDTADLLWEHTIAVGPIVMCSTAASDEGCLDASAVDISAEMIDGSTFLTAWRAQHASAGAGGFYVPLRGDADGDGAADIAFLEFAAGSTTRVISGATGAEIWNSPGLVLGALGTDPTTGTPLVLVYEDAFDPDAVSFDLVRLDGRTGQEVARVPHRFVVTGDWWEFFILIELWTLPDTDGDTVADPFTQVTVYAGPSVTVDSVHESGVSGAPLFARHADRELFGIPLGDLDGDGTTDLLDLDIAFHRTSLDLGLAGTALPSGTNLWSSEIRLFRSVFGFLQAGGRLNEDTGTDLLFSAFQDTPVGSESAIRAIAGATGARLWQRGSLTVPPPPGTASITGTLTGNGEPFFGGCVSVFGTDGTYLGTEIATSSGSYNIPELDAGGYKLEFASCLFEPFASEWFDDQPDFDAANVLVLTDGETLTGIDADLTPAVWED